MSPSCDPPDELELFGTTPRGLAMEKGWHKCFEKVCAGREWFRLTDEQITAIKEMLSAESNPQQGEVLH